MIVSATTIARQFCTYSPTTGALANADSLPTGTLTVNGVDNAATVTVTNVTTGVYKWSVTLPALTVGDLVAMRIAATVSSVSSGGIVWQDYCDRLTPPNFSALGIGAGGALTETVDADAIKINGSANAAAGLAGIGEQFADNGYNMVAVGPDGITSDSFDSGAITAAAIAAGALDGKGDWAEAGDAMALTSGERTTLAGVIWSTLTSTLTTVGSIGKLIKDFIGSSTYSAPTSQQQIADALKLAPSTGSSAAGSVYSKLDAMLASPGGPGDGDVSVNHNTGGTDALRVTHNGVGVDECRIRAYLKSDYDAGSRVVRGEVTTGSDGRWIEDMMLDPGVYRLTFDATGKVLRSLEVTVNAD